MTYAIIVTGGKQYRVSKGDTLRVEKINSVAGAPLIFDQVLMVVNDNLPVVGKPLVKGAKVLATVLRQESGETKISFYKRRRAHSRRKRGHRQQFTVVQIDDIKAQS